MRSLAIGLNRYCDPVALLKVLGVETVSNALPMTTGCPLCGKPALTVFEDTITGGSWHHCAACGSAGDMIELAAAAWDMSPAAAVDKLARDGLPLPPSAVEEVDRYVAARPGARKRIADFWAASRIYLCGRRSRALGVLRAKFRLESELIGDRWRNGPGRLIGANHKDAVVTAFHPGSQRRPGVGGTETGPYSLLFPGGRWHEALVLPFHDVPERICGFWLAARRGDVAYRVAIPKLSGHAEAGLYGTETVAWSGMPYGDRVVAVGCPALAARIQLRHFATSTRPLPLVAWYEGKRATTTAAAWRQLNGKHMVFWCLVPDASTFHQAIITDGSVSIVKVNNATSAQVDHYIRDNEPRDLVRKILRWSKPWRVTLSDWAATAAPGHVEELLLGLERYGHRRADVCADDPQLEAFCTDRKYARTVSLFNRLDVTEYQDQWWTGTPERPQLLMNATLRIDAVVFRDDVLHYQGQLFIRGDPVPFVAPAKTMKYNAVRVLEEVAARHGYLLYVSQARGRMVLDAAMAFHTPAGL